ncbi:MAG: hypothetical protein OJI67_08270, partial [Prosthecobacter sp.]|nr:hypothetical protein [Prosthecobacter sp.]
MRRQLGSRASEAPARTASLFGAVRVTIRGQLGTDHDFDTISMTKILFVVRPLLFPNLEEIVALIEASLDNMYI